MNFDDILIMFSIFHFRENAVIELLCCCREHWDVTAIEGSEPTVKTVDSAFSYGTVTLAVMRRAWS